MRRTILPILLCLSVSWGYAKGRVDVRNVEYPVWHRDVVIFSYPTARSLLMEYLQMEEWEPEKQVHIALQEVQGMGSAKRFLKVIEARRAWALSRKVRYLDGSIGSQIHIWTSRRAEFRRVQALFAHELGHLEPEFNPCDMQSEPRAVSYAIVASMAYDMAMEEWKD